jgi:hypothetical protein
MDESHNIVICLPLCVWCWLVHVHCGARLVLLADPIRSSITEVKAA